MRYSHHLAGIVAALSVALAQSKGVASVPRGYAASQTDLTISVWFGGFDYLPDGRLILSDSEEVFILEGDGTRTVVASFEAAGLYGSFVKVGPDGSAVYVGESSLGTISRFSPDPATVQSIGPETESVVAEIAMNYELAFDPQGRAFVSAAIPESDPAKNCLLLLDTESGQADVIAEALGWSGPLVFDKKGNLYYCTSTSYPPQPVESVIFFTADQVNGAVGEGNLADADAQTYVSGIYGFSGMVFDDDGDLFGTTTSGTMVEIFEEGGNVTSRPFATVSPGVIGCTVVRFRKGLREFEPYHQGGGTLTYLESDFWSVYRLVQVTTFPEFRVISLDRGLEGTAVRFATEEGKEYQVYCTDDLTNGGWQVLGPRMSGAGKPVSIVDSGGTPGGTPSGEGGSARSRFYRVATVE